MPQRIRLAVTSIVRRSGLDQPSGYLRVIDLDSKEILLKIPVPESAFRAKDPNPRGGLRGAKGVSVWGDCLVVANSERLIVFDSKWNLIGDISNSLMGCIHDILAVEDGVWTTCSCSDLLIKVNWQGEIIADWEWRKDKKLISQFGFSSMPPVDRSGDFRDPETMRDGVRDIVHLNGICHSQDGLLLNFGRILSPSAYLRARMAAFFGGVAKKIGVKRKRPKWQRNPAAHVRPSRIKNSSAAIVALRGTEHATIVKRIEDTSVPIHNVLKSGDRLMYNDSNIDALIVTSLMDPQEEKKIAIPGEPSFARGLARLDSNQYLVGSQRPAAIYLIDIDAGIVIDQIPLDGEVNETVYGLCILPPHFDDPPPDVF